MPYTPKRQPTSINAARNSPNLTSATKSGTCDRETGPEKLESYWLGPALVHDRHGEHSYVIKLEENRLHETHRAKLKPYLEGDSELGSPVKLFHFKQARQDSATGIDEWNVEKVIGHRKLANGELEFRVKWETSPDLTWEPLHHFFHRYAQPIVEYFQE